MTLVFEHAETNGCPQWRDLIDPADKSPVRVCMNCGKIEMVEPVEARRPQTGLEWADVIASCFIKAESLERSYEKDGQVVKEYYIVLAPKSADIVNQYFIWRQSVRMNNIMGQVLATDQKSAIEAMSKVQVDRYHEGASNCVLPPA